MSQGASTASLLFKDTLLSALLSPDQWPGLLPIILPDQWNRSSVHKRLKICNKVCNWSYFIFQIPCTGPVWQTRKREPSITPTTLTFTVFPQKGRWKVSSGMGFFQVEATILPGVGGSIFSLGNIWHYTELSHSFSVVYDISDFLCNQHSFERSPSVLKCHQN